MRQLIDMLSGRGLNSDKTLLVDVSGRSWTGEGPFASCLEAKTPPHRQVRKGRVATEPQTALVTVTFSSLTQVKKKTMRTGCRSRSCRDTRRKPGCKPVSGECGSSKDAAQRLSRLRAAVDHCWNASGSARRPAGKVGWVACQPSGGRISRTP